MLLGIVYGGTAGSTFKLPPLTQGGPAVVDQHGGHYNMLKDSGYQSGIHGPNDAHKPDSIHGEDPYWYCWIKGLMLILATILRHLDFHIRFSRCGKFNLGKIPRSL